jgi:Domain of unknown function (DUF4279)
LTAFLGVTPTKTWKSGDKRFGTQLVERECGWSFDAPGVSAWDVSEELSRFLAQFGAAVEKIRIAQDSFALSAVVAVVVYVSDQTPAIAIPAVLMKEMLALNATLDIDLILTRP